MAETEETKRLREELERLQSDLAAAAAHDKDGLPEEGEDINRDSLALQRQRDLDREMAKFTAAALDRASTSLVTAGVVAPVAGILFHANSIIVMGNQELAATVVGCLVSAFVLHYLARGRLEMGFR